MFLKYAEIHHHKNARALGFFCGFWIDDFFLHPHRWNFQLNSLIDNLLHELRTAEDVYDVDFFRDFQQRRIGFFSQRFSYERIDGNDFVTLRLHVGGNAITRAHRAIREPDYSNGFCALQQVADRISFRTGCHVLYYSNWRRNSTSSGLQFLFKHSQGKLANRIGDFFVARQIAQVLHQ